MSNAVQYCHQNCVIHRYIKTENLLLDANGNIKLIDFGLAVIEGDEPQWTYCGTDDYLAPEILVCTGYGKEVDNWATGILVYELLAGSPPFTAGTIAERHKKMMKEIQWPVGINSHAQALISGLLQVDSKKRLSFDSVLGLCQLLMELP